MYVFLTQDTLKRTNMIIKSLNWLLVMFTQLKCQILSLVMKVFLNDLTTISSLSVFSFTQEHGSETVTREERV